MLALLTTSTNTSSCCILLSACAFVTYERWGQAESALAAMNNSSALDAAKGMSVKFADAKIMPDMGHNNKRNFGMEGFGVPSKRAFTGGMQGMPGFNPYGMAGMGYDMSGMMSMGYNGMMGAMPGMHGMVRRARAWANTRALRPAWVSACALLYTRWRMGAAGAGPASCCVCGLATWYGIDVVLRGRACCAPAMCLTRGVRWT